MSAPDLFVIYAGSVNDPAGRRHLLDWKSEDWTCRTLCEQMTQGDWIANADHGDDCMSCFQRAERSWPASPMSPEIVSARELVVQMVEGVQEAML